MSAAETNQQRFKIVIEDVSLVPNETTLYFISVSSSTGRREGMYVERADLQLFLRRFQLRAPEELAGQEFISGISGPIGAIDDLRIRLLFNNRSPAFPSQVDMVERAAQALARLTVPDFRDVFGPHVIDNLVGPLTTGAGLVLLNARIQELTKDYADGSFFIVDSKGQPPHPGGLSRGEPLTKAHFSEPYFLTQAPGGRYKFSLAISPPNYNHAISAVPIYLDDISHTLPDPEQIEADKRQQARVARMTELSEKEQHKLAEAEAARKRGEACLSLLGVETPFHNMGNIRPQAPTYKPQQDD